MGSAAPETDPAGRLDRRGRDLPVIDGTLTRLTVERLPHDGHPKPVRLWTSAPGLSGDELDGIWTAWLRRFDIEHTFRFLKQTLGWTTPRPRTPAQADTWTWMVIAAVTPLGLARTLVADLRLPWEAPAEPGKLTPARVRRGFRHLRPDLGCPARAPKPSRPVPDGPKAAATPDAHPPTTPARPPNAAKASPNKAQNRKSPNRLQAKKQAKVVFGNCGSLRVESVVSQQGSPGGFNCRAEQHAGI
jgi:hypothetical protein